MNDKDKFSFMSDEIKEQQRKVDEEMAILKAYERLRDKFAYNSGSNKQQNVIKDFPTEYSADLHIPEKIYVALYKIESGKVADVVASLLKLEPSYGEEKAFKDARNYLSRLYKAGIIDAEGEKTKGYTYSIKKAG